jgi:ATP-dependent Clp protease ATP-binding subunit ClpX
VKSRIVWPLAFLLFTVACGPIQTPPAEADVATRRLVEGVDKASSSEIRAALLGGARADASAAFGNSALHFACESGDAALTSEILNHLSAQKRLSADLSSALTQPNKQEQSPLELAVQNGHKQVIDVFGSFCDAKRLSRTVIFPVVKKIAAAGSENLVLLTDLFANNPLAAQLIYETVGTKEGQSIMLAMGSEIFLKEFAKAYLLALESTKEVQAQFFKVASGFRIAKRAELISVMREQAALDLFHSFEQQMIVLSAQFGVVVNKPAEVKAPPVTAGTPTETKKPVIEDKELPPDQNALLREAVKSGNIDALHKALENGARLDAVDGDLQNVYHIAAKTGQTQALTTLLSQLQCSNAAIVLASKDSNGSTPFAIAATHYSKTTGRTLRAMTEFLLSGKGCQKIAKKDIREWVKAEQETPIKNVFAVFSEAGHGIEVLTDIVYRLMAGSQVQKVTDWVESSLCQEAKDHLWARVYFKAVNEGDEIRKGAGREIVKKYGEVERQQVVGFMLFLASGHSSKVIRTNILAEVEQLQLSRAMFEASSDGIAEIKAALDESVTGQEAAKVSLAVAIKNHYARVAKGMKKSNILILGPSGTGKTLLVETIAKKLDVPFTVFDATNITQAGYVGGKASDAVASLAQKAEYDKEKTERGIIFLDEIDKMAARSGRSEQDEFKRQAQVSLLKMFEGIEVEVELGRSSKISIDTKNILFVCAGAFTGLLDILGTRLKSEGITFSDNPFEQVMATDLIKYGLQPEFLGRLPNMITLKALTVGDLVHILNNPKQSALEEQKELFIARGVEVKFTEEAIKAIAERAVTYNTGARGLRTVTESVMSDLQFRIGQMGLLKSITVTERVVRYGDMPSLEYKPSK